jgi:hypothetical protein
MNLMAERHGTTETKLRSLNPELASWPRLLAILQ